MKRIDVLKGIEQILVQKAYEKGHISHRKDGDWQKTDDGWVRVKGGPAPDTDDSAERAEYERQLTEEQNQRAEDDPTGYGYEEPPSSGEYGEITEEDLIETPEQETTDIISSKRWNLLPQDVKDKMFTIAQQYKSEWAEDSDEDVRSMAEDDVEDISQMLWDNADEETRNSWLDSDGEESYGDDEVDYTYAKDIDYSQYDDDIKSIEFRENDDGELEPHDDDYFRVADKIYEQTDREDMSDEEADQLYDGIVDRVIDRAYALRNNEDSKPQERKLTPEEISELVKITDMNERKKRQAEMLAQKSAFRDMRSVPTTKNMGF